MLAPCGGPVGLAVCLVASLAFSSCKLDPDPKSTAQTIVIATGGPGGVYHPLATGLAGIYTERIPFLEAKRGPGSASNVNALAVELGRADLAFVSGPVVYLAYTVGTHLRPEPHTRLRGIAVLHRDAMQVIVRADSDFESIGDLEGRRVAFGARQPGPFGTSPKAVLEAHGLRREDILENALAFREATTRVLRRELDAAVLMAGYPLAEIAEATKSESIRLLPFEPDTMAEIRSERPFAKQVTIPKGTYAGQEEDVQTIGLDNVLICRDDLSDELVYQLTTVFFQSLPDLAKTHLAAQQIDPEQGPITPIPLHPGAARFYRERELSKW